jgi:hypothetical protein
MVAVCAKCQVPTRAIAVFAGDVGACHEHVAAVLSELMEIPKGEARRVLRDAEVIDLTEDEDL